jgi:hypothetical protein
MRRSQLEVHDGGFQRAEANMKDTAAIVGAILLATCLASPVSGIERWDNSDNRSELAGALRNVTVLLENGVSASEHHGMPISAKYEIDGGRLQLSVYTTAHDQFWEVIVDHQTGNVRGVGPIRGDENLATAQSQKATLANARFPLAAAIAEAVRGAPGYRAVSAAPTLNEGRPVLKVMLVSGNDWKSVSLGLEK